MQPVLLQRAIAIACENVESGGGPFGCVVVRDGVLLAESGNRVVPDHDPTAHAEVLAIRLACRALRSHQLEGCDVYCSCEPCPMCLGALYWARPRAVYFAATRDDAARAGFDDAMIYEELRRPPEQRLRTIRRVALDDATRPFELWRNSGRKVAY